MIHYLSDKYSISLLCSMFSLSRNNFYQTRNRSLDLCGSLDDKIDRVILSLCSKSDTLYSSRKIRDLLALEGIKVSQRKVTGRLRYLLKNNDALLDKDVE